MTTLAEHIIVAGFENRPPMLEKSMYDSWASRICLFIKGKKHGRMMFDLIDNGLLVYPIVKEDGQTRPKKYSEFTEAQQLQDDYDVQATNIILHGLPLDVYALGETLYEYYWRFSQLINDMHTIGITMQQVQVNTMFLNALPPEWSKFITDVKLAKSLYTTNYDQLYAYLSQNERHPNEVCIMRERYPDTLALATNSQTLYNPSQSPQHSGEDPIDCINKALAFLSAVESKFPPSNNQLKINKGIATTSRGNYAASQPRVVKCYNCQGEGHMARQWTQPKRPRSFAWFKEKLMLAEAQEAGQILDEEQLAFIAAPGVTSENFRI
ncbi:reverse transcriptase domain-containing protein [Tanacetum coccineum]